MRTFFDALLALIALALLSPLLILIMIAIVLDSPGDPFFRARRVGKGGREFRMWKFRTMVIGAARIGPAITGPRDSRITRLGHFLRKTKLDELPQFINVLLGDMSVVGPRPESPEIVAYYSPEQRRILDVKPGMTGRVQLDSTKESDSIPLGVEVDEYYVTHLMERKLRLDLDYLNVRNAFTDMQIIFATAALVLRSVVRR